MRKSSAGAKTKATQQQPSLEAQLQATLNVIPAYTSYAGPSGALTLVNQRTADYIGLRKTILCASVLTRTQSGLPIFPFCV
jgi:hypothetical protein